MPNRSTLYSQIARAIPKAISTLIALLDSNNEAIRMGAARDLINKALPDVKAMEITGENQGPIIIRIIEDHGNTITDKELSVTAVNI